jgi:hypothetical protein
MFKIISQRGKNALELLFWFYLFTYVPLIPAYYIMSLKGILGLSALIYVVLSMSVIFKIYTTYEKNRNFKKSIIAM